MSHQVHRRIAQCIIAFLIALVVQATVFGTGSAPAHAAGVDSTPTSQPQVANSRNRYDNATVAKKLAALHQTVRPLINYSYGTSTAYPVLFVHGFNNNASVDCANSYWGTASNYLGGHGWTGSRVTLGYYSNDHNCSVGLGAYSNQCINYYSGSQGTTGEDLRHIACELAWYIWNNYTYYGQNVQIVAHSMGGLIVRWAMYATPFDYNFPPYLMVQDIVTLSTPHGGIPITGAAVFICGNCWQVNEMRTNNAFWTTLNSSGQNPQGAGWGTDWSMQGSSCESFTNPSNLGVSWQSALGMDGGHKVEFLNPPCYGHGSYLTDTSDAWNLTVNWCNGCSRGTTTLTSSGWEHSLQNMLYSLEFSGS